MSSYGEKLNDLGPAYAWEVAQQGRACLIHGPRGGKPCGYCDHHDETGPHAPGTCECCSPEKLAALREPEGFDAFWRELTTPQPVIPARNDATL